MAFFPDRGICFVVSFSSFFLSTKIQVSFGRVHITHPSTSFFLRMCFARWRAVQKDTKRQNITIYLPPQASLPQTRPAGLLRTARIPV